MSSIEDIKKYLKTTLSERRYIHSIGVMQKAEELAKMYGEDIEKAKLAGLTHDIAKEMNKEEMLKYVKDNNIQIDEVEKNSTPLLHGKIGADIVKKKYGFSQEIQNAIAFHTTTDPKMDKLAKILYISDKIEDTRVSEDYDIEKERELAKEDIDKTILFIINENIKKLIKKGKIIHPKSIETRNEILLKFNKTI